MTRAAARVALLWALLGAAGCFDVHTVDPGPYVIDDFDDGDFQPADPSFGPWQCYSFDPSTNQNYGCGHDQDTADGSDFSLYVEFTIADPPDGTQQHGGAGLLTRSTVPQDLSRFTKIVFSAKLVSGSPPLPSAALFYAILGCSTASTDAVSQPTPGDIFVVQSVSYGSDWQTFTLAMSSFGSPAWESIHISGGASACLERVDSIQFEVDAQLPDGQSGTGRLNVDDISFQ